MGCSPLQDGSVAPPPKPRDKQMERGEMIKMRRAASTCIAVVGLALLAIPATAAATPKVHFKATAVPIPGFRGTGNILGAGAAVNAEYQITGNEYFGAAAPLKHVNFYLPNGTKLHPSGFTTCSQKKIVAEKASSKCPKASHAGPTGSVLGTVSLAKECTQVAKVTEEEVLASIGTEPLHKELETQRAAEIEQCELESIEGKPHFERIKEKATINSFYIPGGGLEFYTFGHNPVLLEIFSPGHYTNLAGSGGKGPVFHGEVPLVKSVPGAPYASVEKIDVKVGSAYKRRGHTYYYGTLPKKCHHYLPIKTELTFYSVINEKEETIPQRTVKAEYHAPCPRRR